MRGVAIWSRGVLTTALILAGGAVKAEDNTPAYILPEVIISTEAGKTAPKSTAKKQQGPAGHPGPATSEGVSAGESSENTAAGISNETMPVSGTTGSSLGAYQGVSSNGVASDRIVEQVTTVEQVTAEQIEQANAKTLDEAIHLMNGLYVRNGGDGVPRIDVRGFRTRNVILLLDGVPLNATFDGQFDPRAIPVENIASIKVTRGGSSVLYGPGAMRRSSTSLPKAQRRDCTQQVTQALVLARRRMPAPRQATGPTRSRHSSAPPSISKTRSIFRTTSISRPGNRLIGA